MGLLDVLNGMQNGPRGLPPSADAGAGGMGKTTMALLAFLAYKAYQGMHAQPAQSVLSEAIQGVRGIIWGASVGCTAMKTRCGPALPLPPKDPLIQT